MYTEICAETGVTTAAVSSTPYIQSSLILVSFSEFLMSNHEDEWRRFVVSIALDTNIMVARFPHATCLYRCVSARPESASPPPTRCPICPFSMRLANQRKRNVAATPPANCASTNGKTSAGRIPENVSLSDLAIVTAGFANDVDAVNQYAAMM